MSLLHSLHCETHCEALLRECTERNSPFFLQTTEAFDHVLPHLRQHIAVDLLVDGNIVSVFLCAEAVQEVRASICSVMLYSGWH